MRKKRRAGGLASEDPPQGNFIRLTGRPGSPEQRRPRLTVHITDPDSNARKWGVLIYAHGDAEVRSVGYSTCDRRQGARLSQILDLFAEDSWRRVYAGKLEVRPPGAPTTGPAGEPHGRRSNRRDAARRTSSHCWSPNQALWETPGPANRFRADPSKLDWPVLRLTFRRN